MLDFIHLLAMGVAEMAESTIQKGCPHTFGHVVYIRSTVLTVSVQFGPWKGAGWGKDSIGFGDGRGGYG